MDCRVPGFPVLHCLPEFAQTHVHLVGDVMYTSHLLWSKRERPFHERMGTIKDKNGKDLTKAGKIKKK